MSFALIMPSFEIRVRVFLVLSAAVLFFAATYLYLLNETIRNVVRVEDTQSSLALLSSSVGDLESAYLLARRAVNLGVAKELGFSEASRVAFLSRSPSQARLSLANEI